MGWPPPSIEMPVRHAEHVLLVAQGGTSAGGIEEVSTSWQRSANKHGVSPDSSEAPRILTSHELKQLREPLDQLIFSAQEEIDRLYKVVREAGYTLLFCDTAGIAVEHRGDETDGRRGRASPESTRPPGPAAGRLRSAGPPNMSRSARISG